MLVLSTGACLRRDRCRLRDAGLRHWLMRHFPSWEFGPLPITISGLARRLEAARAPLHAIGRSSSPQRLTPLHGLATGAEPLPSITAPTQAQLHATPLAESEPVLFRHEAPCRRFLDMALRT